MKIRNFNEYREMVTTGELTFEKLFKGTEAPQGFEIATKIAKSYEKLIMDADEALVLSNNELDMIKSIFMLIAGFGKIEPDFQDRRLESILYALISCAKDGII